MGIYILCSVFLLSLSFFKKSKSANLYLLAAIFILIFIGGLRSYSVGTDTENYLNLFNEISVGYYGFIPIELGWRWVNQISLLLGFGYRGVLFFEMFLAMIPLYFAIKRSSIRPIYSLFFFVALFFYCNIFNTTRQCISMSIILLGTTYLLENRKKPFLISVGLAFLFHYSSIFTILFLLINKISIKRIYFVIPLLFFSFIAPFTVDVLALFKSVFSLFGETKYLLYIEETGRDIFSFNRLLLNLFFVFIYYFSDKKSIYLKLLLAGILVYNIFSFSEIVGRLAQYFMLGQVILYANIDTNIKGNTIIIRIICILYALSVLLMSLLSNKGEVTPYMMEF